MADIAITRSVSIVVNEVDYNNYGDMVFTDMEGNDYKISVKRVGFFKDIISPGKAVTLNYAMSPFGKEYIYNAKLVEGALPPPIKPTTVPVPPTTTSHEDKVQKNIRENMDVKAEAIERLFWLKEDGKWLRLWTEHPETCKLPDFKNALAIHYFAQMQQSQGFTVKKKEKKEAIDPDHIPY